jgi:hypothetical protein
MDMAEEHITLSNQEAFALLLDLLDGIEAAEEGEQPVDTWAPEMRLWMELILNRLEGGA